MGDDVSATTNEWSRLLSAGPRLAGWQADRLGPGLGWAGKVEFPVWALAAVDCPNTLRNPHCVRLQDCYEPRLPAAANAIRNMRQETGENADF